jgi:peptidoglycan hydrolase CwlO-like protein
MAQQLGENTKVTMDLKTIGIIIGFTISLASMYFVMQADIAKAMEEPKPTISKTEWELKDELIRNTIMETQEDVEMILEKLDKLDERIYEIQKNK